MSEFLTSEKKLYYLTELDKCKKCLHPDWDLDDNLVHILDEINSNQNVQTMFSKRSSNLKNSNESYLQLTCTEDIAEAFKNLTTDISENLKQFKKTCSLDIKFQSAIQPDIMNKLITNAHLKKLDAVANVKKYTSINRLFIRFYSNNITEHEYFWEQMLRFAKL
jgi:hypothetical protein